MGLIRRSPPQPGYRVGTGGSIGSRPPRGVKNVDWRWPGPLLALSVPSGVIVIIRAGCAERCRGARQVLDDVTVEFGENRHENRPLTTWCNDARSTQKPPS